MKKMQTIDYGNLRLPCLGLWDGKKPPTFSQGGDGSYIGIREGFRIKLVLAAIVVFLLAVTDVAVAQDRSTRYNFDVDSEELIDAMDQIHRTTGASFLFSGDLSPSGPMRPVNGRYTINRALSILLQDSGLNGRLTSRGVIVITRSSRRKGDADMRDESRRALLAGVAATGLAAAPVAAQDSNEAPAAREAGDLIVVTGIRESLQEAVDVKRRAPVIADVISSTDLGRFPDDNVAESLQRITGVQIQKRRGEGSQVSIRGLPPVFTQTTLNGRNLASAFNAGGATRSFEFGALPSEFVNRLEVYKTPTAAIPEGGLSGTVIIRTPRPLDVGRRQIAVSVQGAYDQNAGDIAPKASALLTDTFADDTVGVTLGVAYQERVSETQSLIGRGFRRSRQGVQNIVIADKFVDKKERASLLGTVEWEPTPDARLFIDGFYSSLETDAPRFASEFQFGNSIAGGPTSQINPDLTTYENVGGDMLATRLGITNVEMRAASRWEYRDGDTYSLSGGGDFQIDSWNMRFEASYSKSQQTYDNLNIATLGILPDAAYDATLDDVISLTLSQASQDAFYDPDSYRILSVNGEFGSTIDDEIFQTRLDFERETDFGPVTAIKFGGQLSRQEQIGTSSRLVISGPAFGALTGLSESPIFPGTFNAAPFIDFVGAGSGAYLGAYNGPAEFPSLLTVSTTRDWINEFGRENLAGAGAVSVNNAARIDVVETAYSAYGQLDMETPDGKVRGNIGMRYVHTKQLSSGVAPDLSRIVNLPNSGGVIIIPGEEPVTVSRDYNDWLPSANMIIDATDDLLVRFGASRTMARPNLADISPSTTAGSTPPTITSRNPNLDPFRANNFDAAIEWYYDDDAILSATLFYKDIVSLIVSERTLQNLPVTADFGDGTSAPQVLEFAVQSLVNGDGATLKGIELGFQDGFSGLPGFLSNTGVLLNYTYLDNSNQEELVGASKHNVNASAYYESDSLALRVSYTWRSKYLISPTEQEGDGQFIKAGGSLDGNITYNINDNFSVVLEGINLLDTPITSVDGNGFPAIFEDNGRRLLFGARASF